MSGSTDIKKAKPKEKHQRHMFFHSRKQSKMVADIISFTIIVLLAAVVVFPVYWIFRSALMTSTDFFLKPPPFFPDKFLWGNFAVNTPNFQFFRNLWNTLKIVVPCVVLGTLTGLPCAYAFARLNFKGKDFIFALTVGSMLLPTMVTLIPLYIAWTTLGFVNSYWPLILPYLCGGGAFNIFLLRQFMKTIPKELDESAKIDGAGHFRILVSIIIPSIKPAIIVVALLIFIATWNDLLSQMIYIHSPDKYTLVLGLTVFFGSFRNDYAGMFAATCLAFVPGILVYLFGQRYFVEGIVMTGLKN